jgi:hypothetical protein
MIFGTIENDTTKLIIDNIGETEYFYEERNETTSGKGGKSVSYTTKQQKFKLLNKNLLAKISGDFEHITIIHNEGIAYKGYTPLSELKKRAKAIVPTDLSEFYEAKYEQEEKMENLENLSIKDIFSNKSKESKMDKYKEYMAYLKAKEEGRLDEFLKEENLVDVDFDMHFKEFLPDQKIIDNQMAILSLEQRIELSEQWHDIPDNDYEQQVAFIEKHNLWGATPDIFQINDEDMVAI